MISRQVDVGVVEIAWWSAKLKRFLHKIQFNDLKIGIGIDCRCCNFNNFPFSFTTA